MSKDFITGGQGRFPSSLEAKDSSVTSGKPTGQGYGAARKGPDVHGPIEDAVVNETYPQGQSFKTELKEVPNIGVK